MNAPLHSGFFYPNKLARILLLSLEEVLGRRGVVATLNQAGLQKYIDNYPENDLELSFEFGELSKIQATLEQMYGPRAGRGIAVRTGRTCFKYGMREFGQLLGFTDLAFRMMPLESKLQSGAEIFADIFNRFTDQKVRFEVGAEQMYWQIDRCPICWGRKTDEPVCHLAVGILQESLYWVSGGKYYSVEEVACAAQGADACTIQIEKQTGD